MVASLTVHPRWAHQTHILFLNKGWSMDCERKLRLSTHLSKITLSGLSNPKTQKFKILTNALKMVTNKTNKMGGGRIRVNPLPFVTSTGCSLLLSCSQRPSVILAVLFCSPFPSHRVRCLLRPKDIDLEETLKQTCLDMEHTAPNPDSLQSRTTWNNFAIFSTLKRHLNLCKTEPSNLHISNKFVCAYRWDS